MKGNVTRGAGFRGILDYALTKGQKIEIAGNMESKTAQDLAKEFGICRKLRPEVTRPVWHCSLSLPEGENLTDLQWKEATEKLMNKIGMSPDNHQFTVIKHTDTEHEHVHIVASRIGLDSKLWHGQWEARKVHLATQEIEKEMGLTLTKGPDLKKEYQNERLKEPGMKVRMSQKEREMWLNKSVLPPKMKIAAAIENALEKGKGTIEDLKERLQRRDIEVRVNQSKTTQRIHGMSFFMDIDGENCKYKASQIHKKYSWKTLSVRLEERKQELSRTLKHEQDTNTLRISREGNREARPDRQEDIRTPKHAGGHSAGTLENNRTLGLSNGISGGRSQGDSGRDERNISRGIEGSHRPLESNSNERNEAERKFNKDMGNRTGTTHSRTQENLKDNARPSEENISQGLVNEQSDHINHPSVERILSLSGTLQTTNKRSHNSREGQGTRNISEYGERVQREVDRPIPKIEQEKTGGSREDLQKGKSGYKTRDRKTQKVKSNLKRSVIMEEEMREFKIQINLVDYAYSRGYMVDEEKSSKRCTVMRKGSEKIGISVNEHGKWLCYDFRKEKGGTIVDFAQDFNRSKSLGRVRLELRPMLTISVVEGSMGKKGRVKEFYRKPKPSSLDTQKIAQEYAKMMLTDEYENKYLKSRNIKPETPHEARFYGCIKQDKNNNICFPHKDEHGVSGVEKKNHKFNGFSEGGYKSLWFSYSKPHDNKIVICESGIDALSYFELYDDKLTQYCSIGGQMNKKQLEIIDRVIEKNPNKEIVLAFDNDENGRKYAKQIKERNSSPNVTVDLPKNKKDWNEELQVQRKKEKELERKLNKSHSMSYSMSR